MANFSTHLVIRTSFIGYHCWPDAPEKVCFLRNLHRHRFGVKVAFVVRTLDRELEFFILQAQVCDAIQTRIFPELERKKSLSCEMMATELLEYLRQTLKLPAVSVEISEDDENSAIVTLNTPE